MAASYTLPPPSPLDIHGPQAAEKWKKFELAWNNYALATELDKKSEAVQVATLLTVIGEEARDVFSTFTGWEDEGDKAKIKAVLAKFAQYCQPRKNIPTLIQEVRHRAAMTATVLTTLALVVPYGKYLHSTCSSINPSGHTSCTVQIFFVRHLSTYVYRDSGSN